MHLLENPKSTTADLCQYVLGPDLPTRGEIITPAAEILEMYETGRGSIRQRAVWEKESGEIVVSELPYQASGSKILEQIAAQMAAKKLPMVSDLRDESDQESPIRLIIEPRSNRVDVEMLMQHLFATTDRSTCIASRVYTVSSIDSPLLVDIREALRLITSADSRLAAISKVVRVRVLGSKNRLTTVLPRSKGTFLISRFPKLIKLSATSRICIRFSRE